MSTTAQNNRYTLRVTELSTKAAKYGYEVIDNETGAVISSRKSNREYVACTIDGSFYFGRLDLIGKGDHGRRVKSCEMELKTGPRSHREYLADDLAKMTTIAYK